MKRFGVFLATFLLASGVMAASIFNFEDTWDNAATTWYGYKWDLVDTGHHVNSRPFSLQVSATPFFEIDIDGNIVGGTINGVDVTTLGVGDLKADGTVPLTANWDAGAFSITGLRFISDQATGTSPFTIASTTVVTNLNADLLDGSSSAAFATSAQGTLADSATQPSDNISTLTNDSGFITTVEGTAVLSTGEIGGSKFLREDGDGTSSWQTVAHGLVQPLTAGITAFATGGQANATLLTSLYNVIGTVGTAGDSVKLESCSAGTKQTIINSGANILDLFPNTSDAINQGSVDVAVSVGVNNTVTFICIDATTWVTL